MSEQWENGSAEVPTPNDLIYLLQQQQQKRTDLYLYKVCDPDWSVFKTIYKVYLLG